MKIMQILVSFLFLFFSCAGLAQTFSGTGFFISKNGYLATAYHVIEGTNKIQVKDSKGITRPAEVVVTDKANDLAILQVSGDSFFALQIRSSSEVKKGASVFTIGFPNVTVQGRESKVTQGIVSSLSGITGEPNSFQTSVALQPGNSGGPLLDLSGSVIGVVSSKLNALQMLKSSGQLPENVNYAVKSNYLFELAATDHNVVDAIHRATVSKIIPLEAAVALAEQSVAYILVSRVQPVIQAAVEVSKPIEAPSPWNNFSLYTVGNVAVRKLPNYSSEIVIRLGNGESLKVITKEERWYKVRAPNGEEGWVHEDWARIG